MTSFIHLDYATEHPGVARVEAVASAAGDMGRSIVKNFDATRSLAAMLLAAFVAALVVVADLLIDTWADGHLLAAWVILWAVAFSALALFAPSAKRVAKLAYTTAKDWTARRALAHNEARYWESAMNDPRIMAEIQAAKLRQEQEEIDALEAMQTVTTPSPAIDELAAIFKANRRHMAYN
jgi:hypothetical protein